jgi:hypothetical protein
LTLQLRPINDDLAIHALAPSDHGRFTGERQLTGHGQREGEPARCPGVHVGEDLSPGDIDREGGNPLLPVTGKDGDVVSRRQFALADQEALMRKVEDHQVS